MHKHTPVFPFEQCIETRIYFPRIVLHWLIWHTNVYKFRWCHIYWNFNSEHSLCFCTLHFVFRARWERSPSSFEQCVYCVSMHSCRRAINIANVQAFQFCLPFECVLNSYVAVTGLSFSPFTLSPRHWARIWDAVNPTKSFHTFDEQISLLGPTVNISNVLNVKNEDVLRQKHHWFHFYIKFIHHYPLKNKSSNLLIF